MIVLDIIFIYFLVKEIKMIIDVVLKLESKLTVFAKLLFLQLSVNYTTSLLILIYI